MNKISIIFIFLILFLLIVYLFYTNKQLANEYNTTMSEIEIKIRNKEKIRNLEIDSENHPLPTNIRLEEENGKIIYLKDICSTPKLIFRYSEINCNVCIDAQVEIIKEKIHQWGEENVIFLSTYQFNRDLLIFKRINQLKLKIYNSKENLPLPTEKYNTPYFFIYNPENDRAVNVFIPLKEFPQETFFYLNSIYQKYFK